MTPHNKEIKLVLCMTCMFNKCHYLHDHLVLNRQNTDSQSVCNAVRCVQMSIVLNAESSKLTRSTFQNLTFSDWFHWFSNFHMKNSFDASWLLITVPESQVCVLRPGQKQSGIGSTALIMVKELLHLARVGTIGTPNLMPAAFISLFVKLLE